MKLLLLSFIIKNRGEREGTEIAHFYICDELGSATPPVKSLKRFQRVTLQQN
jgi:beta-glucosidase